MIKTNPLSIKDIKLLASKVREKYGIEEDEAFPILDVLNELFYNDSLSIQLLEDNDPYLKDNVPALYNAKDNFIYLKESVITEIENSNYRSNFTLAHEFFHYLQNQVLGFTFEESIDVKPYEDPEWQANVFAGELLLPSKFLCIEDNEHLATHFKVSLECVLTRKVKNKQREDRKKEE